MHSAGGEHDVVRVPGHSLGRLPIGRQALLVEAAKGLLVPGQRSIRPARPPPRVTDIDLELHGRRALAEQAARLLGADRAAAERDHLRLSRRQRLERRFLLDLAERGLAPGLEDHGDRVAGPRLDLAVEVDEGPADPPRRLLADRRLAGPHEADQRDVSV